MAWVREEAIRAGVSAEEFEKRFLKHLSEVEGSGPKHDSDQGIAKEIKETIAEMDALDVEMEQLRNMRPS